MLIFNTTFHVEDDIHSDFLEYIKLKYIPEAIKSGKLYRPQLAKVHSRDEDEGHSYALQFEVDNIDSLDNWNRDEGNAINNRLICLFKDKMIGFATILQKIELP